MKKIKVFVTNISSDKLVAYSEKQNVALHHLVCNCRMDGSDEIYENVKRILSDQEYDCVKTNGYYLIPVEKPLSENQSFDNDFFKMEKERSVFLCKAQRLDNGKTIIGFPVEAGYDHSYLIPVENIENSYFGGNNEVTIELELIRVLKHTIKTL